MTWTPRLPWQNSQQSRNSQPLDDEPLRGELFSVERLEEHAESLAHLLHISTSVRNDGRLTARLHDNEAALRTAYLATIEAIHEGRPITSAADWLVDNFHLVEEQVRAIRNDLSPGFLRQLPKLTDGVFKGYPRVLALAWVFVLHTDSRFDPVILGRFIRAYQRVQPLQIGELWALAITLRVVLVENLRRIAVDIVADEAGRNRANLCADRVLGSANHEPEPIEAVLFELPRPLPLAFAVQMVRRMREDDPHVMPALHWLDQAMQAQHTNASEAVQDEQQRQGAANATIGNIITSMRLMSAIDWREVFESISLVDAALAAGSNFADLDPPTRKLYRDAIEELSRGSAASETEVAQAALCAAHEASPEDSERYRDPGYYLIGRGRPKLETSLTYRATLKGRADRLNAAMGIAGYLALVGGLTAIIIWLMLDWASSGSSGGMRWLWALLAIIPASDAAVTLVNCGATHRFDSKILPGLELVRGVPAELRTMVVIPTLLTSPTAIAEQVKRLEVHHLANCDGDLSFALLSDWTDAPSETAPDDAELLHAAIDAIAALNLRYGPGPAGARFLLLHRKRLWNDSQHCWIGWERKRGKLHEFNRLLRGATDTSFIPLAGLAPSVPDAVRYVIVLDGDTRLPRGSAIRLIGKMAHPLNRPVLDGKSGRVVDGYAVLQPRVSPALPTNAEGSVFQRVFANTSGMDPYASAVSDVYQDLFGEGSYCGKGIYDVDAFEGALAGRIPDNTLLSHDLLEGIFARAGLVSDIEVIDEFPTRYDVAASRHYRWARGDWQLLPWILGLAKSEGRSRAIPLVGRWKMIDNLRRSLSAPAGVVALLAGWTLPIVSAERWTLFILATIALPAIIPFLSMIIPRSLSISMRMHAAAVWVDLKLALSQTLLLATFLADQACLMADAILRTLFRLTVSRRFLLEWTTAAQTKSQHPLDVQGFYRRMIGGVVLAVVAAGLVASHAWPVAAPFLLLWLIAPAVARWISLPGSVAFSAPVTAADTASLRLIARRTWSFFETFVTAQDNMLPPDNFQEDPLPVVAHRTSPTNLGLYLLSVVAAVDFGWIDVMAAAARLDATLASMGKLERHLGHFYNWYDTQDRRPLEPKYISSVDSGNLAGHLLVLWNACSEMANQTLLSPSWRVGLGDTLALIDECQREAVAAQSCPADPALNTALLAFKAALTNAPTSPPAYASAVQQLAGLANTIVLATVRMAADCTGKPDGIVEALRWSHSLQAAVEAHQASIDALLPWAKLAPPDDEIAAFMAEMPNLATLPVLCHAAAAHIATLPQTAENIALNDAFARSATAGSALSAQITTISTTARQMFDVMSFSFLFDKQRELLSIGFRVEDGNLDANYYDLLASEARLASFVAIARGDLPTRHWLRLGRLMAPVGNSAALISWSGSMFEYLMPSLVMRAPAGSLLEQTSRQIVRQQMAFGTSREVPWGVSESAYNARDLELTYQYSSFGIPSMGFKRGLGVSTVIAPYATALASMVDPHAAVSNFATLTAQRGRGQYGWYEALDYTTSRVPDDEKVAVVRAYMAHHQGMSIVAIADAVMDGAMRARFHNEPIIQATELLLQERMPHDVITFAPLTETPSLKVEAESLVSLTQRRFDSPHTATPHTQLLSNGRYAVMLTASGSGYSRWGDVALTRWQEDSTCDQSGSYVFVRDVRSGKTWSAGYQPTAVEADSYDVEFSEGRAEICRQDGSIATTLEVVISSEDDAEVRRVSITNHASYPRDIEITSYGEIVLATQAADTAHPVFSKLFVATEFVEGCAALLATRRQRSPEDPLLWAAHLAVVEGESLGDLQYETDRARFIGRGRTLRAPAALDHGATLSGTLGAVLDPIFSLRCTMRVEPMSTVRVAFWTMIANSRTAVLDLVDKHRDKVAYDRAVTLAWTQAQVQLRYLGIGFEQAHLFQRLANQMLYADPALRPSAHLIAHGAGASSLLWQQGISGDLPILLLRVDHDTDLALVREVLLAHEYWRMKQLHVDVVIINERRSSYAQEFQESLVTLVASNRSQSRISGKASRAAAYVLRADVISEDIYNLLQSSARMILIGYRGALAEQMARVPQSALVAPPGRFPAPISAISPNQPRPELAFDNGLGGFAEDGREYVITLGVAQCTPMPWINVVANSRFGFQTSADGSGMTWAANSQQNRITPWNNDPVGDAPGEVIYLRDEDTGQVWSPTALPIRVPGASYVARFGQGYSQFEHESHGIATSLLQFVPLHDSIKISRLTLTNTSGHARNLSVTGYVEWVLGPARGSSAPFVITEIDSQTNAMLARNKWSIEFGSLVAFADMSGQQNSWTGDRQEFLGRHGTLNQPNALASSAPLSNHAGAGRDPCAALQTKIKLAPNASVEIVFLLGQAASTVEAQGLIETYRHADLNAVLAAVKQDWDTTLSVVAVTTPDAAMDIMLNRWLLYQTLACRVWARSAFYQSSGAYGFRDQLQDGMALCLTRPQETRAHLLRAAGRQFIEGDVQHWWLPETGKGVRTLVSDDRIWLAHAVAHYVTVTGDTGVLDEIVPFLEGPVLHGAEGESYFQPNTSDHQACLLEHCALALDHSLAIGAHGLPLIGTGDWNDGMNRVGAEGKGESIWLGWFLHATITAFAPFLETRGALDRAQLWRNHARDLATSLERDGWDGGWYRRAYFDDGTPLGSATSDECQIDSIVQSWAVISGAANPAHAATAVAAVDTHLVRRDDAMVLLFTPPFDHTQHDPGYIKGYPPGIRENGGQYTHAAIWSVIAFAMLGQGDKAHELFAMLNPIQHTDSPDASKRYKVEPYVTSADVYSVPPHVGRGGWTWYTGSAGWLYRAGLESILGFQLQGAELHLAPCIPASWPGFSIVYRHQTSRYTITVENPRSVSSGVALMELDGLVVPNAPIALVNDGAAHTLRVVLG